MLTLQSTILAGALLVGSTAAVTAGQNTAAATAREGSAAGSVNIDVSRQRLSARLTYEYVVGRDDSVLVFFLDTTYKVTRANCDICAGYRQEVARLPRVVLTLTRGVTAGERIRIDFEYDGSMARSVRAELSWLELGLDDFWFPVDPSINGYVFRHDLVITGLPDDYALSGNGKISRQSAGWRSISREPDFDIDLVAAKGLRKTAVGRDVEITLVDVNLPDSVTRFMIGSMESTLSLLSRWFPESAFRSLTAVFRPHPQVPGKGGYFRKGYFILDRTENGRAYERHVTHELAHHWFWRAPPAHAWLNESIAEYVALLTIRELRGMREFDALMAEKEALSAGLPPVYGFDRGTNPGITPAVLYAKGPVKLAALEKQLGTQRFLVFLDQVTRAQVTTTNDFFALLARVSSPEAAAAFQATLKDQR